MRGCSKLNQWKPVGATPDDCATAKKSVEGFLNYLVSNMEHDISQVPDLPAPEHPHPYWENP